MLVVSLAPALVVFLAWVTFSYMAHYLAKLYVRDGGGLPGAVSDGGWLVRTLHVTFLQLAIGGLLAFLVKRRTGISGQRVSAQYGQLESIESE